ncbi:MAG: branched-chain amino acid transaminase [Candidatus Bathyarchaeia archaeon]
MGKYPYKKVDHIWLNGELVKWDEAKLHILSHVVHYGSGVFEGIRCYLTKEGKTAIFRLDEHLDRFQNSARMYMMDLPYSTQEISQACRLVVKSNHLSEGGYIRPIAYRAYVEDDDTWGYIGLNPLNCPIHVAVITFEFPSYGAPIYRCITSGWRRISPDALPTLAKACGQYLNSQLAVFSAARMQSMAEKSGLIPLDRSGAPQVSYEAILLDHRGFVSEGAGENIFLVKKEVLHTPPIHASILRGITRASIIELARNLGYEIYERDISKNELYSSDEIFMTGTAAEVKPVVEVDGMAIGDGEPGPVTKRLQKKFSDVTHGRDPRYIQWLTIIE